MMMTEILKTKRYGLIALASAAAMLIIYPYAQTLGNNMDLWFEIITPLNLALYIIFSLLFGPLVALQIHNLSQPKTCKISAGSGTLSSILSFSAIQCPGCVSIVSLFLPISATTFLATYSTWITAASIALLILGIYLLGGVQRQHEPE
ncbi:MAG: hypothetical protein HYX24_04820 [Candidatus Aenigmarchaeota archaeon]|nr:hypothetical protein [Candidatus Aenigmarchaeota archaeon]